MTQTEMDDAQGSSSSNAPAPFLTKTYEMVDDPYTSTVVSWSQSGCSFVVWNPPEFAQDLLPKYFKHNNFSSFVRQLNTYGFRKVDPDQWEFANEEFIRGQKHLLKNIYRRKPIHSHSLQNRVDSSPLTESEKYEYEKEIKRLKHEKNMLQIELRRHQSEKQSLECQILSLGQKLQGMDSRQNQLTSFLSELMQKPGFPAILSQQVENNNKKRRLSTFDQYFDGAEENRGLTKGNNDGLEMIEKLDSSLKFWEDFLYQVGESFGEETSDFSALSKPSLVVVREVSGSYADGGETWSPRSPSPDSRDISPSSPELTGYKNHSDEPRTPPIRPESLQVDVNCNSEASPPMSLAARGSALTASAATAGTNDHFWENFLTEAPDSHRQQDPGNGSDQNASFDRTCDNDGRFWWSTHYRGNNSLTKHVPS